MPSPRLLVLFFGSGACALIYQVVWMRALALTLSVTVYAVTTVLCAFMAGLGLGAAFAGRLADRLERPLLVFGLAELGIGVMGLLMPTVLFALAPSEIWLTTQVGSTGLGFDLGRFLLASAVLLSSCTLMGMTLPSSVGPWWRTRRSWVGAPAGCTRRIPSAPSRAASRPASC